LNEELKKLSKEELINYIEDISKNWLAIDGTWFQVVEKEYGLEKAMELDVAQWKRFTVIEAKRIKERFNLPDDGGIPALIKALNFRVYANINVQEVVEISEKRCVFRMNNCRVQYARKQRGLPDFPCKAVGVIEYGDFAKTIDPRIETKCICCPPDPHPEEYWCSWEFVIKE
jgi:hypothetical protein